MKNIRISRGQFHSCSIEAISSKSYVHRLLIAAGLSDGGVSIKSNIVSEDMKATVRCLNSMGALIEIREADGRYDFIVKEGVRKQPFCSLDCGESGSTARFLIPIAAFFSERSKITGHGKLPGRPFGPLCEAMKENGALFDKDILPMNIEGTLRSGEYVIPGNVSSQFISGLLFALPLLDGDSSIKLTSNLESSSYVDMTIDVLERFGIKVTRKEDGFFISGGQKYQSVISIEAEGDWSNGAYLMAMGSFGEEIEVTGLNSNSIQGDKEILSILKNYGKKVPLTPVETDCRNIPDLVPAIAVLALYSEGISTFLNVERLRIKESDRITSVQSLIEAFGGKSEVYQSTDENGLSHENLRVFGKAGKENTIRDTVEVDSFNDHRIVMAAAIAGLGEDVTVIIKRADAVNKSYPGFFEVCKKMGMNVEEI